MGWLIGKEYEILVEKLLGVKVGRKETELESSRRETLITRFSSNMRSRRSSPSNIQKSLF